MSNRDGETPSVEQLIAAPPNESGVLIAGPGAGKSYRIGQRVDSLIDQGLTTSDIVLLTLTNETARTLRRRFPIVPVRTVHSYALSALNELGDATGKRVADEWEEDQLVARDIQRLTELGGVHIRVNLVEDWLTRLGMGFRENQAAEPVLTAEEAVIRRGWERVREFLALRLFEEFAPDLIDQLQEGRRLARPPRAVVVDEYQDLTAIELRLIEQLAETNDAGVFACGDDRQSIYSFRGADPLGLGRFPTVYRIPGPTFMSVSRRCPGAVIGLAEEVVARMPAVQGFSDRPRMTSLEELGEGELTVRTFPSPQSEARWIVSDIERRRAADGDSTVAVIVARDLGVYVRLLNDASTHRGLAFKFTDSRTPSPLSEEPSFRLAYALLRLAEDDRDELAWRTLLHVAHGIGRQRVDRLYQHGENRLSVALRASAPLDDGLSQVWVAATDLAARVRNATSIEEVIDALELVAAALGVPVPNWYAILAALETPRAADEEPEAGETIGALPELGRIEGPEPPPWRKLLAACRRTVHEVAADREAAEDEIFVYTIYAAKGQQWHHVYLAGAYQQGFLDRGRDIGEGVRLLYVAVSRAMRSLAITKPNWVRDPLLSAIGSRSPSFPRVLREACAARHIDISAMARED